MEKRKLFWWEHEIVQPIQTSVWRFLRKLNEDLPWDPAITPWVFTGRPMSTNHGAYWFTIIVDTSWNQPKCVSAEECIEKTWLIGGETGWNVSQAQSRRYYCIVICRKMGANGEYFIKQIESASERHLFPYSWILDFVQKHEAPYDCVAWKPKEHCLVRRMGTIWGKGRRGERGERGKEE